MHHKIKKSETPHCLGVKRSRTIKKPTGTCLLTQRNATSNYAFAEAHLAGGNDDTARLGGFTAGQFRHLSFEFGEVLRQST